MGRNRFVTAVISSNGLHPRVLGSSEAILSMAERVVLACRLMKTAPCSDRIHAFEGETDEP